MEGYIEVFGSTVHETDEAIMCDFGMAGDVVWLPKSQLEDWPDVGDSGEVLMPEWLAEEKGLM